MCVCVSVCLCVYVDWTAVRCWEMCNEPHYLESWAVSSYFNQQSLRWKTAGQAKVGRNVPLARITTVQNNLQPQRKDLYSHAADLYEKLAAEA